MAEIRSMKHNATPTWRKQGQTVFPWKKQNLTSLLKIIFVKKLTKMLINTS